MGHIPDILNNSGTATFEKITATIKQADAAQHFSNPFSQGMSGFCHNPNDNTTQPQHSINNVVGLDTKMTVHT